MTKKQEFINALTNLKNKGMMGGFDPQAIYTQATLETGHIKEDDKLVQNYNLFGVKSHEDWKGAEVEVDTAEVINGKLVNIKDWFISFADFYKMLVFYMNKIQHDYPNAYNNRADYREYFKGLLSGVKKWSTSPAYADTLIALYDRMKKEGDIV